MVTATKKFSHLSPSKDYITTLDLSLMFPKNVGVSAFGREKLSLRNCS